jgi:hypothetical protein
MNGPEQGARTRAWAGRGSSADQSHSASAARWTVTAYAESKVVAAVISSAPGSAAAVFARSAIDGKPPPTIANDIVQRILVQPDAKHSRRRSPRKRERYIALRAAMKSNPMSNSNQPNMRCFRSECVTQYALLESQARPPFRRGYIDELRIVVYPDVRWYNALSTSWIGDCLRQVIHCREIDIYTIDTTFSYASSRTGSWTRYRTIIRTAAYDRPESCAKALQPGK